MPSDAMLSPIFGLAAGFRLVFNGRGSTGHGGFATSSAGELNQLNPAENCSLRHTVDGDAFPVTASGYLGRSPSAWFAHGQPLKQTLALGRRGFNV